MSQGTLFAGDHTRCLLVRGLIKHYDLDIKIEKYQSKEHLKNFPLGKVPAFIDAKGYKLNEVIAIIIYLISLKEENSKLLGKNTKEYAQVLKWVSFGTSDFLTTASNAIKPLTGNAPYNKKIVDTTYETLDKFVEVIETRLKDYTFLVGERLTIADLFLATCFYRPFNTLYGKEWLAKHPALVRWWKTVVASPILSWFFADFKFLEKPLEAPKPAKKEKAPKENAQAAPKAAKKEAAPAEEPVVEEKKPKHPLELLGKSSTPLDEWKRQYSNEDTRKVALPWFWNSFYNPEEWSIYRVDYKYNDELTLTFMSNNLVGGFFNRLSASTKFMFGCMVVYGENNNNGIVGAFLVRGQEFAPAFDVAPDWESYAFTKLDASKEEDKAFVNNMWAWDEPVDVNGEKKEIADGKVFK